ncbi:MAG TPA: septal ring lytic transglycosylase RlpA family protein [Emcibacteraceae bacterium]|nr:septal ring lytic transglycosylase RlpA family protein [Emcibacteraceae bacterium]HRW30057.1 septal ring lytic transglycosylase RlpA family protein [Emcibacteraceae bacterium]
MTAVLSACGTEQPLQTSAPPPPGVKIGEPYKVAGKWYTPKEDPTYNEVGIASWYGEEFHAKRTANGEVYDMNSLTAAHTTLPMPSYVRVTNLENNRSLILRVNDRGPFVGNRLIDVSRRGAQLLGFEKRGTTRVRVEAVSGPDAPVQIARPVDQPPIQKQEVASVNVESLEVLEPLPSQSAPSQPIQTQSIQSPSAPMQVASLSPAMQEQGDLYIQVGAYSQIGSASRVMTAVSQVGETMLESIVVNGRKLYRVRVGPLPSRTTADAALQQILKLGHNTAKVIFDD